jgi:hypothetical protein
MRSRQGQAEAVALEMPTQTLSVESRHAVRHPSFTTSVPQLTATRLLDDAVETCRQAKLKPLPTTDISIYKLVRDASGEWECIVAKKVEKHVVFATSGETKFTGKVDHTDASLLDGYMSGEGHGSQIRDADAARIVTVWANSVLPNAEAARILGIAITIRAALKRGVVLESYGAVA